MGNSNMKKSNINYYNPTVNHQQNHHKTFREFRNFIIEPASISMISNEGHCLHDKTFH
jgi:hypothetical protein